MENSKLFVQIWRINAVVILLVGLIASAVLSVLGYMMYKEATRTSYVDNVANTALGDVRESAAELGSFTAIPGSPMLRAPLTVQQTYALGSGSKEAGSTRNYLYFDPTTRSAHWLRPSMDSLILQSFALPSADYGEPKLNAFVYVHVTVDKDSNADDRLTESDAKQIAISRPNGKDYRVLVAKADRLNEATLLSPTRLIILYSTGTKLAAIELNPSDFSIPVSEYEVPIGLKY